MSANDNKRLAVLLSLVLILSGILLVACSKADAEDRNKEVIRKVLELEFSGPNDELMDLLWNPQYTTVVNNKEENKELDKYIEEVYGPYFTNFYLPTFINTSGLTYQTTADWAGYKLNLKEVTIEQSDKASNRYTFTATVGYQKNGEEEKTANVSGLVLFSTKEEGKIGKFHYRDDGLLREMRE